MCSIYTIRALSRRLVQLRPRTRVCSSHGVFKTQAHFRLVPPVGLRNGRVVGRDHTRTVAGQTDGCGGPLALREAGVGASRWEFTPPQNDASKEPKEPLPHTQTDFRSPAPFPSTPCLAVQTSQSAWTPPATRTPDFARRRSSLHPKSRSRRVQRGGSPQTAPPPPDIPCARPLLAGRYDRARQIMSTPRLVPELPELASRSRWAH